MKQDLDTVTNVILNNEYDLHKNKKKANKDLTDEIFNKRNLEDKDSKNIKFEELKEKIENNNRVKEENSNTNKNTDINEDQNKEERKKHKRKKKSLLKRLIFLPIKILLVLIVLAVIFIFLFFKTSLFQKYKEIWVVTAMSTMNHQYLATWFLSDEEIQEILDKLKVVNNEDSNVDDIIIEDEKETEQKEITVEKITGKNYVGYVMIVPNASKVKLVDSRKTNRGTKLSQILKEHNAVAGINAGGFTDIDGKGQGHQLCRATIIDKKLLYGYKGTKYSLIGLDAQKKLVLGNYTYQEAMNVGIESAIEFGPFLIVNGKNQITNSSAGGIHPRMAIGQRKDGTFIFVVVDGRQPGYSLGTNLLELQNIFNKYDAYNAANLDGGSSATMCYNGKVVNKTSTPIGERYLPNAFIVEQ